MVAIDALRLPEIIKLFPFLYIQLNIGIVCNRNQKLLISRPKKPINKDNVMALMLQDLVSVANKYSELSRKETIEIVKRFAANAKVTWRQIKDNIDAYPTRVSQELIKMEIYDVLA